MANSIRTKPKSKPAKPAKPYDDFPLFPHDTKRWAKKVRQRMHYFGQWREDPQSYEADWQAAIERYKHDIPYLLQGKTPPPMEQTALTVGELVNTMLAHRDGKVKSGELSQRSWNDYERVGKLLVASLGRHTSIESLTPTDFAKLRQSLSERLGLVALGNEIGRIRVFFNFAFKNDLVDRPVRMGMSFDKPSRKSLKRERQTKASKVFSVDELQTLYWAAGKPMRAFMALALNCALGNSDIGQMEPKHIDGGWLRYPRPKTLVDRECPLWKETLVAIDAARNTKHADRPFLFTTKYGQSWHKQVSDSPITKEFSKLLKETGLQQAGRGFYALRHTFRTVADGCRDQVAISHIMGHSDDSMVATYREWIEPERLQAVVDHVYAWVKPMFRKPKPAKAAKAKGGAK